VSGKGTAPLQHRDHKSRFTCSALEFVHFTNINTRRRELSEPEQRNSAMPG
jgi:hypothetical protein